MSSESSPRNFNVDRFFCEGNSLIVQQFLVDTPRFVHGNGIDGKCLSIRQQSQKSQLRHATKVATLPTSRIHPRGGRWVMEMRTKSEC